METTVKKSIYLTCRIRITVDPLLRSWRLLTAIQVVLGTALLMYYRMVMTITLLCMVPPSETRGKEIEKDSPSSVNVFQNMSETRFGDLPILIISMYKNVTIAESGPEDEYMQYIFNWSKEFQGHLLSAFFYGFTVGLPLGGILCQKFSPKYCLMLGVMSNAFLSGFVPYFSRKNKRMLIVLRILQGIGNGIGLPSRMSIIAKWSTPREINILLCIAYLGFSYGNLISLHLSTLLCVYGPWGGWPSVYYLLVLLGILYTVMIHYCMTDSPFQHPYIEQEELAYLQQETNSNTESKIEKDSYTEKQVIHIIPSIQITTTEGETEMFEDKDLQIDLLPEMSDSNVLEDVPGFERYSNEIAAPPNSPIIKKISHDASPQEITVDINESIVSYPELIMKDEPSNQVQKCIITQKIKVADPLDWRLVLTYPPAVAGYFACFAATYGWQTFGINQPLFMRDLYGFHIEQNALASSFPWLLHTPTCALIPVAVAALLKVADLTKTRKIMTAIGFALASLIPCIIIELPFINRWVCSFVLTFVEVGNTMGFSGGFGFTFVDMAPQYVSTFDGVACTFLGLSGILCPVVTAYLTPTGSVSEWRLVFLISLIVYFSGFVVYAIFGSSDPHKFNRALEKLKNEKNK